MTIEHDAPALPAPMHDAAELTRFVFPAPSAGALLQHARALLAAAPRELAESFEQAVRGAGLQA